MMILMFVSKCSTVEVKGLARLGIITLRLREQSELLQKVLL